MKDARVMAFINLYAILGTLPYLCELDEEAAAWIQGKKISIGFAVKNGPMAALRFEDGRCTLSEGIEGVDIVLPFSSCIKFNGMIDGTVNPFPSRGFLKIGFLLHEFQKLTDRLSYYLKADDKSLTNEIFFKKSTTLMLHLILSAAAAVANEDRIGRASAAYIVDGTIRVAIKDELACGLIAKGHRLTAVHRAPEHYFSYMCFSDITAARALFDGKANAVASVGEGKIRVGGMISQIDNLNRILDRVSIYLA